MPKLYLEFEEETIELLHEAEQEASDDEYSDTNDDAEDDDVSDGNVVCRTFTEFVPLALYRNPIDNSVEIDVRFDPSASITAHIVVVSYNKKDLQTDTTANLWYVVEITKTRRQARSIGQLIATGKYDGNRPWDTEGNMFERVDVVTLPVED